MNGFMMMMAGHVPFSVCAPTYLVVEEGEEVRVDEARARQQHGLDLFLVVRVDVAS